MQRAVEKNRLLSLSRKRRVTSEQSVKSQLPCSYFNQPKAWMDFNFLDDVLIPSLTANYHENEGMLFYSWTMLLAILQIWKASIITSSWQQPFDLGIILTFKLKCMKLMLTRVVSQIDDCNSAPEMWKSVDLLQAIRWIAQTWENVSESTIKKCFI